MTRLFGSIDIAYCLGYNGGSAPIIFQLDLTNRTVITDAFGSSIDYMVLQIDPTFPGIATVNTAFHEDLAINPCNGTMAAALHIEDGPTGNGDYICTIDPSTGYVTPIVQASGAVDGLSFNRDGTLFSSDGSDFYEVDIALGTVTLVEQITTNIEDLEGLDIEIPRPPIAVDDVIPPSTCNGITLVVDVLANDVDSDNNIDSSSVTVIGSPAGFTTSVDIITGEVSITATTGYIGQANVQYSVSDVAVDCATLGTDTADIVIDYTSCVEICNNGLDDDGDGLMDCEDSDCYLATNSGDTDNDNDGIGDSCDEDNDNDGILDVVECPPTIGSGLTGSLMTFTTNISTSNAASGSVSHTLNSITYAGVTYTDFIMPDIFTSSYSLINMGKVRSIQNGTYLYSYTNVNYDQDILSNFQSRNLNFYQALDPPNDYSDNDYYILSYSNPITSSGGGFLAVVERFGNNSQIIQALDINNNVIGTTINVSASAYVDQGVNISPDNFTQNAYMALYPVEDLAPVGTKIYGLKISFGTTATYDGPDAKVFFFGDLALVQCDFDGDGIPNNLDLDSDNDGCPDAIEGAGSFSYSSIQNDTLTGGVSMDGIPLVASSGQGLGQSQDSLINSCPEICNNGIDDDGDGLVDCDDPNCGFTANAGMDVWICNGASTNLNASGGVGYSWSPSTGLSATNISNPVANPSSTTTYTVTVTDGNGCTATDNVLIGVNNTPIADASQYTILSSGKAIKLNAKATGGSGNYNFNWQGIGNSSSYIIAPWGTTTYTLIVTDSNGCSDTEDVTLNLGVPKCSCN